MEDLLCKIYIYDMVSESTKTEKDLEIEKYTSRYVIELEMVRKRERRG